MQIRIVETSECLNCTVRDAVWEKMNAPGTNYNFIIPVEFGDELKLCEMDKAELIRLQERDGEDHWQPWNYIGHTANSCNY